MATTFSRRTALKSLGAAFVVSKVGTSRRHFGNVEASTTLWLSGAGDDSADNVAGGGFAEWSGQPSTYARIWCDQGENQTEIWMLDAYSDAGWTGTLDIANGGPSDWASAARGGMDSTWTAFCRTLHAKWNKLRCVHLSMAHEMNGDWYPWSVRPGDEANFKAAWARWHDIVTRELIAKGRNVKFCLSYNSDSKQVPARAIYPGTQYVDVIGCDFYNMWRGTPGMGNLHTQADWDAHRNDEQSGSPRGIQAWFDFARSVGKPISFPEWGTSPQNLDDSSFFIEAMNKIFRANGSATPHTPAAGRLSGEAYFNTWDQCRLWPTTQVPKASARYRSLTFGH